MHFQGNFLLLFWNKTIFSSFSCVFFLLFSAPQGGLHPLWAKSAGPFRTSEFLRLLFKLVAVRGLPPLYCVGPPLCFSLSPNVDTLLLCSQRGMGKGSYSQEEGSRVRDATSQHICTPALMGFPGCPSRGTQSSELQTPNLPLPKGDKSATLAILTHQRCCSSHKEHRLRHYYWWY